MCEIIPAHKKYSPALDNVPFLTRINNKKDFNVKVKTQLASF